MSKIFDVGSHGYRLGTGGKPVKLQIHGYHVVIDSDRPTDIGKASRRHSNLVFPNGQGVKSKPAGRVAARFLRSIADEHNFRVGYWLTLCVDDLSAYTSGVGSACGSKKK